MIGQCNLCFKEKELIGGHIMPSWSNKLGEKTLQGINVKSNFSLLRESSTDFPQGSIRENIFCKECDNGLGKGEEILRQMVHPTSKKPSIINMMNHVNKVSISDLEKTKLFANAMAGLVLKAHLSKQKQWSEFHIGKKERMRLIKGINDKSLHQNIDVVIFKLYNLSNFHSKTNNLRLDHKALSPNQIQASFSTKSKIGHSHSFLFGGLLVDIKIYPEMHLGQTFKNQEFHVDLMPIDIKHVLDDRTIFSLKGIGSLSEATERQRFISAFRRTPLDSLCPCMVFYTMPNGKKQNRLFKDCCYNYWNKPILLK